MSVYSNESHGTSPSLLLVLQALLHGIVVCEDGKMGAFTSEAIAWGNDLRKHIAVCHDLVPLPQGRVAGQQHDRRGFAAVEAVFTVSQVAHSPCKKCQTAHVLAKDDEIVLTVRHCTA